MKEDDVPKPSRDRKKRSMGSEVLEKKKAADDETVEEIVIDGKNNRADPYLYLYNSPEGTKGRLPLLSSVNPELLKIVSALWDIHGYEPKLDMFEISMVFKATIFINMMNNIPMISFALLLTRKKGVTERTYEHHNEQRILSMSWVKSKQGLINGYKRDKKEGIAAVIERFEYLWKRATFILLENLISPYNEVTVKTLAMMAESIKIYIREKIPKYLEPSSLIGICFVSTDVQYQGTQYHKSMKHDVCHALRAKEYHIVKDSEPFWKGTKTGVEHDIFSMGDKPEEGSKELISRIGREPHMIIKEVIATGIDTLKAMSKHK
jgi:hypothetical protein